MIEFIDNESNEIWKTLKSYISKDEIEDLELIAVSSRMLGYSFKSTIERFTLKVDGTKNILRMEIKLNDDNIVLFNSVFSHSSFFNSTITLLGPIAGGKGEMLTTTYEKLNLSLEKVKKVITFEKLY